MLSGRQVYFCSTEGGPAGRGQLYRLAISPSDRARDSLTLLCQADDHTVLNNPDNITLSPWGGVFLAEDSHDAPNCIRVLKHDGSLHPFACNALNEGRQVPGFVFHSQWFS